MQNLKRMTERSNPFFYTGLVYKLALMRFLMLGVVLYPILWFSFCLYITILLSFVIILVFYVRYIRFYDNCIEIYFLFRFINRKKRIKYGELDKVSYMYGQYGGLPVVIIAVKGNVVWGRFNNFIVNRFVLGNRRKVVDLFLFLKAKGVDVQIRTTSNSKQELLDRINNSPPYAKPEEK